jgi:ArsR family transcriptional regulator
MDSGSILDILGNDTRRRILAALSREPMYFNQLAKEIDIGQQAILRHLHALEESGLVETYIKKSDLGAPDRKYYRLNSSFVLTVLLSEDDFKITNQEIAELRHKESMRYYKKLDFVPENTGQAISHLQENLLAVEHEISNLDKQLNDLRAIRQLILHRLHEVGKDNFEQEERRVLYTIVEQSPKSVAELSDMVDVRESSLRAIITNMINKMDKSSAKALFEGLK